MENLQAKDAIEYLLSGGKCITTKKYIIVFKDGCFKIEQSGTLFGNFNNLKKYND